MTPEELARHVAQTTNGHDAYRLEGSDMLEAAIITTEKAAHWENPKTYHDGMFEDAIRLAVARANIALAVEMRALREEMAQLRVALRMRVLP